MAAFPCSCPGDPCLELKCQTKAKWSPGVYRWAFPHGSVVKNLPANAGDTRDASLIPGSGRCPGGGNGNPLQYSCLENSMDWVAWWPVVHEVAKKMDMTY